MERNFTKRVGDKKNMIQNTDLTNGNQDNPKAISYPMGRYLLKVIINSSHVTDLLRCPLKTSENPGFSTEGVYLTVYFTKVMNFETFL